MCVCDIHYSLEDPLAGAVPIDCIYAGPEATDSRPHPAMITIDLAVCHWCWRDKEILKPRKILRSSCGWKWDAQTAMLMIYMDFPTLAKL